MYYLQRTMIAINVVLPLIATAATATRFQARRIKRLPLKADDWVILLALVSSLVEQIAIVRGSRADNI